MRNRGQAPEEGSISQSQLTIDGQLELGRNRHPDCPCFPSTLATPAPNDPSSKILRDLTGSFRSPVLRFCSNSKVPL